MKRIEIVKGDITQQKVDAIVNPATSALLGGGGLVDGAIHDCAGPQLLEECQRLKGCVVGTAKMTAGYNLPASHVIHTVGPMWDDGESNEAALLASCYRESLQLAVRHGLRSIAFPAISCGLYQFPVEMACEIALEVVVECLKQSDQIEQVVFVCYQEAVERALQGLLQQYVHLDVLAA